MAEACRCAFLHNITQFVDSVAADRILAREAGTLVPNRPVCFVRLPLNLAVAHLTYSTVRLGGFLIMQIFRLL